MIWNNVSNDERLRLWKNLRDTIAPLSTEEQLKEVAKFSAWIPFGARSIDYYTPENWPTPWEILFYGSFCTSSISLLIFYTLTILNIPSKIELYLVEDTSGVYLLPVVDDHFVLNYELGTVNTYPEIQEKVKVLQIYPRERIKQIK